MLKCNQACKIVNSWKDLKDWQGYSYTNIKKNTLRQEDVKILNIKLKSTYKKKWKIGTNTIKKTSLKLKYGRNKNVHL